MAIYFFQFGCWVKLSWNLWKYHNKIFEIESGWLWFQLTCEATAANIINMVICSVVSIFFLFTEAEKAMKSRKETLGTFNHIPFYMKLHEAVKGAHLNYKVATAVQTTTGPVLAPKHSSVPPVWALKFFVKNPYLYLEWNASPVCAWQSYWFCCSNLHAAMQMDCLVFGLHWASGLISLAVNRLGLAYYWCMWHLTKWFQVWELRHQQNFSNVCLLNFGM